ncbi:MAG: arsD [Herbinix sp.]|jgi:hypothetical protein|nr:arsD [Herbinix sp.]
MKKLQIFEPAMCCDTGLCGVGVDPELLRLSTLLNSLKKNGVIVERFNLSSAPLEFITNKKVNVLIQEKGVEILPLAALEGEIIITGRYPSNEEFVNYLEIPREYIGDKVGVVATSEEDDCGCGCSEEGCCASEESDCCSEESNSSTKSSCGCSDGSCCG